MSAVRTLFLFTSLYDLILSAQSHEEDYPLHVCLSNVSMDSKSFLNGEYDFEGFHNNYPYYIKDYLQSSSDSHLYLKYDDQWVIYSNLSVSNKYHLYCDQDIDSFDVTECNNHFHGGDDISHHVQISECGDDVLNIEDILNSVSYGEVHTMIAISFCSSIVLINVLIIFAYICFAQQNKNKLRFNKVNSREEDDFNSDDSDYETVGGTKTNQRETETETQKLNQMQYQKQFEEDDDDDRYINYFRLKTQDPNLCICRCCTLWLSAHVLLIFGVINNCFNIYLMIYYAEYFVVTYMFYHVSYLLILYYFVCLIVNFFSFYGLYQCVPRLLLAQWISYMTEIIMFFGVDFGWWLIVRIIYIIALFISVFVFRELYKWARYFKRGGVYYSFYDNSIQ